MPAFITKKKGAASCLKGDEHGEKMTGKQVVPASRSAVMRSVGGALRASWTGQRAAAGIVASDRLMLAAASQFALEQMHGLFQDSAERIVACFGDNWRSWEVQFHPHRNADILLGVFHGGVRLTDRHGGIFQGRQFLIDQLTILFGISKAIEAKVQFHVVYLVVCVIHRNPVRRRLSVARAEMRLLA